MLVEVNVRFLVERTRKTMQIKELGSWTKPTAEHSLGVYLADAGPPWLEVEEAWIGKR